MTPAHSVQSVLRSDQDHKSSEGQFKRGHSGSQGHSSPTQAFMAPCRSLHCLCMGVGPNKNNGMHFMYDHLIQRVNPNVRSVRHLNSE